MKKEHQNTDENTYEYYKCQKTEKNISKRAPVCPSPNIYCKYRHMCVIYELYKEKNKTEKINNI